MEDAHIIYLDDYEGMGSLALFGVFDGHGGPAVSRWVAMNFINSFKQKLEEVTESQKLSNFELMMPLELLPNIECAMTAQALENCFLHVDDLLKRSSSEFERELRVIQNVAMQLRKEDMRAHGIEEPTSQSFFKELIDGKKWRVENDAVDEEDPQTESETGASKCFADLYEEQFKKTDESDDTDQDGEFNKSTDFPDKSKPYDPQSCGCTAVVAALITEPTPTLVVGNAGDSRCVLSRNGIAVRMTVDHKPMQVRELKRIRLAGGTVANGRVDSNLNLSRSLGDLHYKRNLKLSPGEQKISPVPDLTFIPLCNEDDFIILACDGIWDVMTEQQCVTHVQTQWTRIKKELLDKGETLTDGEICEMIASDICDTCLAPTPFDPDTAGAGCDNMTAMVIRIKDEWRRAFPASDHSNRVVDPKLYGNEEMQEDYKLISLVTS